MLKITSINRVLLAGFITSLVACGGGGGTSFDGGGSSAPQGGNNSSSPAVVSSSQSSAITQSSVITQSSSQVAPSSVASSSTATGPVLKGNPSNGQAYFKGSQKYNTKDGIACAVCHGAQGGSASALSGNKRIDQIKSSYEGMDLASYIAQKMPTGGGFCTGSCADDVAAYMIGGFDAGINNPASSAAPASSSAAQSSSVVIAPPASSTAPASSSRSSTAISSSSSVAISSSSLRSSSSSVAISSSSLRSSSSSVAISSSSLRSSSSSSSVASSTPALTGVIFQENFENYSVNSQPTGWDNFLGYNYNTSNTTSGSNYALVDSSRAYGGTKSIRFKGGLAQIVRALPANTERLHLRAYVNLSAQMGGVVGDNHEHIMGVKKTQDANNEIRVGQIKGTLGTNEVPSDNIAPKQAQWEKGKVLNPNTWYCIETSMYKDTAYDELRMWVDNELVHSVTSGNDWNNGALGANWMDGMFNYVMFGFQSFSGRNLDVWMDDIVVATNPVGCGNVASSSSAPASSSASSVTSSVAPVVGNAANGKTLYESATYNCAFCHGATGQGGALPNKITVKATYTNSAAGSQPMPLAQYIAAYMPAPGQCTGSCANDIAAYINNGFKTTVATSSAASSSVAVSSSGNSSSVSNNSSSGNTSSSGATSSTPWVDNPSTIASCDLTYGPRGLRVLTRSEFTNSIEDLTGINILRDLGSTVYASLPADNLIAGFSNNVIATIEPGSLQSYGTAVGRVVEELAAKDFAGVVSCGAAEGAETCGMKLIETFLPKVLRRSLTETDIQEYLELFTPEYSGGDAKEGLKLALRVALTSPDFLYRDETGVSIIDIENGSSGSDGPEYEPTGTVQTMFDGKATDPGYYAGGNVNFIAGYNLIEIVGKALVGGNGSWPVLVVSTTGFTTNVTINASYNKVYRVLVPTGAVTGNQHLQFRTNNGNNQIMMDSVKVSGAREKVQTAPPVVLDRDAYVLTPYQLATYLAFTFTGSTPDAILLKAAQEEGLETKAQIEAQVERLLATPRARERFGEHAVQWLRANRVLEKPKSPEAYPTFNQSVREAMVQEVRDVYTHVVLEEGEPFRRLFDGDFTFVNKALADFYGISGVSGNSMQKVKGLTNRGGLMTSGAFMVVNSHDFDNAPILRSVYFRKAFMCQNVPEPPTGVSLQGDNVDALREESIRQWEIQLAAQGGKATPKQKYEFQTSAALCATCHEKMINPLGAGFEDFSPVGLVQSAHYTGLPVDARGTLYGITNALGYNHEVFSFTGAKQLAAEASGYDVTRQCFVDNSFRMATGTGSTYFDRSKQIQLTTYEKSNYACEVQKLDNIMKTTNYSTKAMLKALGSLDSVRYRKNVQR